MHLVLAGLTDDAKPNVRYIMKLWRDRLDSGINGKQWLNIIYIFNTIQMYGLSQIFFVIFFLCSPRLHLFDQNTVYII